MSPDFLQQMFSDHTFQIVTIGSLVLGITTGALGCFAILRQQSLLGDAIAHATLPGICFAFLLTESKHPLVLLLGAGIAGWVGTIFSNLIIQESKLKRDTALGLVLSTFFGLGLVLITIVQKLPTASKAGLDKFLFGNAATLLEDDIKIICLLSAVVLSILFLMWKEFKGIVFDYDFIKSLGFKVRRIDVLLTTLIVISIVIGLQTVGVVLMSAMLVAPAAAARQWTNKLSIMVLLSSIFGATAGVLGAVSSSLILKLPTGPMIVVYISVIVFISLIFAPRRGLLWDYVRTLKNRKQIQTTTMLKNLLLFSEINTDPFHPHNISALEAIGRGAIQKTMIELQRKGWATQFPDKRWALTKEGLKEAKQLTENFEESIS